MAYNKVKNKLAIVTKKSFYQNRKKIKFISISEKQSRDWRFRCIARLYLAGQYRTLFTGHTATDRAETAFLQLVRGTSLHGMTSFRFSKLYRSLYPKYYNYSNFS